MRWSRFIRFQRGLAINFGHAVEQAPIPIRLQQYQFAQQFCGARTITLMHNSCWINSYLYYIKLQISRMHMVFVANSILESRKKKKAWTIKKHYNQTSTVVPVHQITTGWSSSNVNSTGLVAPSGTNVLGPPQSANSQLEKDFLQYFLS